MGTTTDGMVLDAEDLNPSDRGILDTLRDGRVTPAYVADEHNYTTGNIRNRMTHLASHGHVRALGGGLYELVSDPRDNVAREDGQDDAQGAASEDTPLSPADREALHSGITAALRALEGQSPNPDTAHAELERALEVLDDAE